MKVSALQTLRWAGMIQDATQENPEGNQDPVLPSTSNQQPDPTGPGTRALASAVEARALSSLALALTMAQIQEATATGDDLGNTDEEKIWLDAYKGVMRGLHAAS